MSAMSPRWLPACVLLIAPSRAQPHRRRGERCHVGGAAGRRAPAGAVCARRLPAVESQSGLGFDELRIDVSTLDGSSLVGLGLPSGPGSRAARIHTATPSSRPPPCTARSPGSASRSTATGRGAVDGADVPGRGNRESVWIGPARRHALKGEVGGLGFYLAVWAMCCSRSTRALGQFGCRRG